MTEILITVIIIIVTEETHEKSSLAGHPVNCMYKLNDSHCKQGLFP
jgi:hypothetical protein